jgi:hypothetical protein
MSQLVEERGRLVDAVIEQANSSTPQLAAELAKSLEVGSCAKLSMPAGMDEAVTITSHVCSCLDSWCADLQQVVCKMDDMKLCGVQSHQHCRG